jgi:hypothetical protein
MKYLLYLTLLVAFTFLTCGLVSAQEWHVETIDTLSFAVWWTTSIALDSNNYPHIVYGNANTPGLRYAHWTGTEWDIEFIESIGVEGGASIAIDSQDKPRIAYAIDNILKYAVWNGTDWEIETVVPEYASVPSVVLDSQDEPHIAFDYCEVDDHCDLRYAYWSEGQWEIEIVDPEEGSGWWVSLALDGNEYPHISYFWDIYGSKGYTDLRYAHWTGSEWQTETVGDSSYGAYTNSIAVDSQNYPHISYRYSDPETDEIRYAHWTGSSWDIQALDSGFYVGASNSMALDNQDNPCIAYNACFDETNSYLRYAHWTGGEWDIQDVDYGAGIGVACSLALDSHDYPYISYVDADNNTLKLAWYGYDLSVNLLSFTATPQQDSSVLLNWRVETTEGEQIAGFNLYRRDIVTESYSSPQKKDADWTKVNPYLITGQNPYAYTDSAVETGKSYEYKLEAVLADESTQILGTASCAPTPPAFAIAKVYPNPASDVLNIALTLPQSGEVTLELYDLSGRLVESESISENAAGQVSLTLNVSGLTSGLYTLRAVQGCEQAIRRVVVSR